jgi:uncharacterized membrane protein
MIQVQFDNTQPGHVQIDLRSNLSMSLDRFAAVFLVLSLIMLLVAVYPLVLGLWPVMVIASLHIGLVGWCFRQAWRGNWVRQTLHFGVETVTIEHLAAKQNWRLEWPVSWLKLITRHDQLGQPRLYLQRQGQAQEIGAFLPSHERMELRDLLNQAMAQRTAWKNNNF